MADDTQRNRIPPAPTYLDPAEKLRLENAAASAAASKAGKCATGGSSPGTPGSQDGTQGGYDNTPGVKETQSGIRRAPIQPDLKAKLEAARVAAGIDQVRVFSGGQNDSTGYTGSFRHNNGWAADVYLYKDGRMLDGTNPADRAIMSKFITAGTQAGLRGWGWGPGYMGVGGLHADVYGFDGNVGVWGADGLSANAAPWVTDAANKGAPEGQQFTGAGGGNSPAGNSAGAACHPAGGGSGCSPISTGAAGAAASMAAGKGLAAAAGLVGQLASIAQNPLAIAQLGLQTALSSVAPGLGQAAALATTALTNPVGALTQTATNLVTNIGAGSPLSALTGVIPAAFSGGGLQGLLTQNISNVANSIIQQGVPHLGNFAGVLNSSLGAAASAADLSKTLSGSMNQVFGRATNGSFNDGTFPGLNLDNPNYVNTGYNSAHGDYTEGIEGMDGVKDSVFKNKLKNIIWFPGNINDTLVKAVNTREFDAFTSLYFDYNSMVTQGYGQLTDNLLALGRDLKRLGLIGDMADLLNIGTAKQLVRQLLENGLGIKTGILRKLYELNLDIESMYDETSEPSLYKILDNIDDPDVIQAVKDKMLIDDKFKLNKLSDLLNAKKVFVESHRYNRFAEIRDMALTMAICTDGIGSIKNFYELGSLFTSLETAENFEALNKEYTPIREDEVEAIKASFPVDSYFGSEGPVLADFIGTAAGYVHADTLPKLKRMLDNLVGRSELNGYNALLSLLTEVLKGTYTTAAVPPATGFVTVPSTAGYTFIVYNSLDEAVTAVINAINIELQKIYNDAKDNDEEFYDLLLTIQGLHDASAAYLHHEKKMRQAYGVDIGESRGFNNYIGDDSTLDFVVTGLNPSNVTVHTDGSLLGSFENWTYNSTTKKVSFSTPPAMDTIISISYDVETSIAASTPADTWQLASNLESFARQTGFGGPADFINRIATNDRHGQRIKAIMIQARNKARLDTVGVGCKGYNRVLNENGDTHTINFIEQTGIWSNKVDKAADIWLFNSQEVETVSEYVIQNYKENKGKLQTDIDKIVQNIIRRLLFVKNGYVIASKKFVNLYSTTNRESLYEQDVVRLSLKYNNENIPTSGQIIGPFDQIASKIVELEGLDNDVLKVKLNDDVKNYLAQINIDLEFAVALLQKIVLISIAQHYGLKESETIEIFGIQSVSKTLLYNTANGS